jgi:acetyl-CoA synthetase
VDRGRLALIWAGAHDESKTLTYFDFAQLTNRLANVLRRLDVKRGDRVAALMPRRPETFAASLATWKAGATFVPLFSGFGPDAIRDRLATSEARVVITEARYRDVVERGLHADVPIVVVAGERGTGLRRGDLSFWGEVETADSAFSTVETTRDEPCALMFTSGTTGPPKGCIIPHGGLVGLIPFAQHVLALRSADLLWATSDPGWTFGLFSTGVVPMALGFPRLVYEGDFDARAWWRICARYHVTHVTGTPTAYRSLAAAGEAAFFEGRQPTVMRATSAGEPLNPEPIRWLAAHSGFEVYDAYGITEVGMVTGNPRTVSHRLKPGSMGFVLPGYDIALLDEHGKEAALGESGMIAVRRHQWFLSSGYWNRAEEWDQRWCDEWFLTGDTAYRDEEGYLWFVGRHDDVIVTAGMNVGPFEIESALVSHPDVAEAAVVGKPDPRRGQVVKAYVVLRQGEAGSPQLAETLQGLVRDRVGRHAWPRDVEFVQDLPRTESGKIVRAFLRRQAGLRSQVDGTRED